jgi:hypothetical protein
LEGDEAVWTTDGKTNRLPISSREVQFFVGLPEIGKNYVWKLLDSDPTLFLNYFQKAKSSLLPIQIFARRRVQDAYLPVTFVFSLEMLEIFGADTLHKLLQGLEVLSLRNMCREGVSLTHKEWKFIAPHLNVYPIRLSEYLLNGVVNQPIEPVLVDFLECLLKHHPLTGKVRVCNKLLPLLQFGSHVVHLRIQSKSRELKEKISSQRNIVYERHLSTVKIAEMETRIKELAATHSKSHITNQTSLTGCPSWYNSGPIVAPHIIAELLMGCSIKVDFSQIYTMVQQTIRKIKPGPAQAQIIDRLTSAFYANFTRSPDELLAVGYTKVAQVLLQLFTSELHAAFAENSKVKVAVAPVKDLQRCIAKFVDYKPPCSSHICDYLRASVLCQSFSDIEGALVTLCTKFKVTRIKSRIGPSTTGNKAILVNLVVKDETIKCNSYAWSGWWDKQPVQMLAEVQICQEELFYLDKQEHHVYEIVRTQSCAEWVHQQGYAGVEKEMFPNSPLHHQANCLL